MTDPMRPPQVLLVFILFFFLGEAASLLHPQVKSRQSQPEAFYKKLASNVDTLAAAADFAAQEQAGSRPAVADNGANVLKSWSTAHELAKSIVADALKSNAPLRTATQAHAVMRDSFANVTAVEPMVDSGHQALPESAASGENLLRQWSASKASHPSKVLHSRSAPPASQTRPSQRERKGSAPPPSSQSAKALAKPAEASKTSAAFAHAHALMRELGADQPSTAPAMSKAAVESTVATVANAVAADADDKLAASGHDLLAKWAKGRLKQAFTVSPPRPSVAQPQPASAEKTPQTPAISIRDDLRSMRSAMKEWEQKQAHQQLASASISDAEVAAKSDMPEPVSRGPSEDAVAEGAQALEHWNQQQAKKKSSGLKFMPRSDIITQDAASRAVDSVAAVVHQQRAQTDGDVRSAMKALHQSAVHEAMRQIGSTVPDQDAAGSDAPLPAESSTTAGADALDRWSKAHAPPQPKFMQPVDDVGHSSARHLALPVAAVHDQRAFKSSSADAKGELRSSMKALHQSAIHDAMRKVGSDVPDVDTAEAESVSPAESLTTAGADALAHWSKAHAAPSRPKFVDMDIAHVSDRQSALPVAAVPDEHAETGGDMRSAIKVLHQSAVHEAMRNVGNSVPDLDAAESEPRSPTESLTTAGADALDHWSKAHAPAPTSSKFMIEFEHIAQSSARPSVTAVSVVADEHAVKSSLSDLRSDLRSSMKALRQSAVHEAMRNVGSSAPDENAAVSELLPSESLRTAGADTLDRWSKAHAPAPSKSKFMAPTDNIEQSSARPSVSSVAAIPVEHAPESASPVTAFDMRSAAKALHQSAVHEAMRNVGSSLPDAEAVESDSSVPTESLSTAGADALARWSKAHSEQSETKSQVVPAIARAELVASSSSVTPVVPKPVEEASRPSISQDAEHGQTSTEKKRQSSIHEAMHNIGNDALDLDTEPSEASQVQQQSVDASGGNLMEDWSRSHSVDKSEKKQSPAIVDMYPATPAPATDILALAMSRGFGKRANEILAQPTPAPQVGDLQATLRAVVASVGLSEADTHSQQPPSKEASKAGADILSRWSQAHR